MNNEAGTNQTGRQKWIILLLIVIFLLPMTLSYYLFYFTSFGEGGGEASHGILIDPPRQLPDLALRKAGREREETELHGKWSLIYLVKDGCDEACDQNLYRMRQLRLAQGKHGTRVQRVLLNFGGNRLELNDRQIREYAGQLISSPQDPGELLEQFRLRENGSPLMENRLYLVDPRGFLMMGYPSDADPGGIIDDMKRLLRYSSSG